MKNAYGFIAMGHMLATPVRLKVSGGDDRGFAVLAGKDAKGTLVQVLITNYAIPASNLAPQLKDTIDFNLPVAGRPVPVSWKQLPRRVEAAQKNNAGYDLSVSGLPWGNADYEVDRYRLDADHDLTPIGTIRGHGRSVHVSATLPEPGVELLVIRQRAITSGH
jgi:xylan 1,4-beta-xylosidase